MAVSGYRRPELDPDERVAGLTIVGAEDLKGIAAVAAKELQQARELSKVDPSFECTRHTMIIMGRPVQVILVLQPAFDSFSVFA